MERLVSVVWMVVGLALIGGGVGFYRQHKPQSFEELQEKAMPRLKAATSNPLVSVSGAVAVLGAIGAVLARSYRPRQKVKKRKRSALSPLGARDAGGAVNARELIQELIADLERFAKAEGLDAIAFVHELMEGAVALGASDVHIQPDDEGVRIYVRVHGSLKDLVTLPMKHHALLIGRLKVLAKLVSYHADRPQDGVFGVGTEHGDVDVRLSLIPTNHGERAVMRVARSGSEFPSLKELGFEDRTLRKFQEILSRPQGLIFLTGPTGSGKTTTIYASLDHINESRGGMTQIATIEDPIEVDIPFLTQTQIKPKAGLTFAKGLRSLLRQDPNVIMVGEIRDAETAGIAVQAGLTGHLILTTLHADSASGVFNRLIEMRAEPFIVASASLACVSQRLVRSLCSACRKELPPTPEQKARLRQYACAVKTAFVSTGCSQCGGSGFMGRIPIYEMLVLTPKIRELITAKVPTSTIHRVAIDEGMQPIIVNGAARAETGLTSLAEVLRVVA